MKGIEISKETLDWFFGDELRARVFIEKYALRDYNGSVVEKTPPEMWRRVARAISSVEATEEKRREWEEKFYWLLEDFKMIPGGRIMFGAGQSQRKATLLNCYVLPIKGDSIEDIYETMKEMARTYSYGGGVGIDISVLRPKGSPVENAAYTSTGSVSFMDLYSLTTGTIGQCLEENTLVLTKEGWKKIKNIKVGDKVWTHKGWQNVSYVFPKRIMKVFRLKTKKGFSILASSDHKFLDDNFSLKPLRDYKQGDKVVMLRSNYSLHKEYINLKKIPTLDCHITQPEFIEEEFSYWLGCLVGSRVKFNKKSYKLYFYVRAGNSEVLDNFLSITEKLFGLTPKLKVGKDATYRVEIVSKPLYEFLCVNNLLDPVSGEISSLESLLKSPTSVIFSFLSSFCSATRLREASSVFKLRSIFKFLTTSYTVASQLQLLFLSVGVVAKIGLVRKRAELGNLYQITVDEEEVIRECSREDFCYCFGEVEKSKVSLGKDFIFGSLDYSTDVQANLSKSGVILEESFYKKCNLLFVDEVESIEEVGERNVYDIEVENVHKFMAQGFYVSNSGRRGALMITIHCSHPDVEDFVVAKNDPLRMKVRFANISVLLTDEFMEAVQRDEDWELWYPDILRKEDLRKEFGTADANEVLNILRKRDDFVEIDLSKRSFYHFPEKTYFYVTNKDEFRKRKVYKTIKAKALWDKIVHNAWASAEPGVIFYSTMKKMSTSEYNDMYVLTTNPCVTGDTRISTEFGLVKVKELYDIGIPFKAVFDTRTDKQRRKKGCALAECVPMFKTSDGAKVYKVETSAGYEIKATEWHEFYVVEPEKRSTKGGYSVVKKQLADLRIGDCLMVQSGEGEWGRNGYYELGLVIGAICGGVRKYHGSGKIEEALDDEVWAIEDFRRAVSEVVRTSYTSVEETPEIVCSSESNLAVKEKSKLSVYKKLERVLSELYCFGEENGFRVPEVVWKGSRDSVVGFLKGIFSVSGDLRIREKNSERISVFLLLKERETLKDIQILLANFGIFSRIRCVSLTSWEDWSLEGKRFEKLGISGYLLLITGSSAVKFMQEIGFLQEDRNEKFKRWFGEGKETVRKEESFTSKVRSIEYLGIEPVFDTTQFYNHSLIFNGIVTGNCSEISLEPYGDCCLGNINLERFVLNEFQSDAEINWDDLEKAVRYTVRFLDNVLEYNKDRHPLREQSEASMRSRRIGVGFTGLGDMLIKMRIKYDSEEAIDFVNDLFNKIKHIAYDESVNLAKEKGPFPNFDAKKHLRSPFIRKLDRSLQEKIKEYGLRNVALLTVPPVGSGALLAGVTSGIEPVFALSYIRRSESLSQEFFKVYHPLVKKYMEKFGIEYESQLPDFFVTAHEIEPYFRVKMQATIQKHIDHSISSTVNLPESTSEKTISDIYFYAWKLGCKGITVYREGSREGVLITEDQSKKKSKEKQEFKRPRILSGETLKFKLPQGTLYVTVNKDSDGTIKEVFINIGKSGGNEKADAEAIGRLISIYLQSGGNVEDVIKQLEGIKGEETFWDQGMALHSIPDAVAKALSIIHRSSYEEKISYQEIQVSKQISEPFKGNGDLQERINSEANPKMAKCPTCGERTLVNENGCFVCKSCGYTKCS
ncbi:MAG: ribonucleotide reductase N-terminal alpha domain-containing protein [Brevinematia bacterium]